MRRCPARSHPDRGLLGVLISSDRCVEDAADRGRTSAHRIVHTVEDSVSREVTAVEGACGPDPGDLCG